MWFGTQKGLVRFDGIEFTQISLPNDPQFRSQMVTAISSSRSGGLWFGIDSGAVGFYDGNKSFSSLERESWVSAQMNVRTLAEVDDGSLWVGSGKGTAHWIPDRTNETVFAGHIATVSSICEDSDHRVWLGTTELGLYYWQNGEFHQFPDEKLKKETIFALAVDAQGLLWVGTQWGLHCYERDGRQKQIPPMTTEVRALLVDHHGVLWAGTSGDGLIQVRGNEMNYLRQTNGLVHDVVLNLYEDKEGSLWVGTREGLSQISDVKFPIFSGSEGSLGGASHDVCVANDRGVWVATARGISQIGSGTITNHSIESGLSTFYIKRVFAASDGDVYMINGNRDIEILSEGKAVARYENEIWPTAISEDQQGVVVAVGQHLFRASRTNYAPYVYPDGREPSFYWIRNLSSSRDGSLLVASVNGVFRIRKDGVDRWAVNDGLLDYDVLWVSEDKDGSIWAGLNLGISHIKGSQIQNITHTNGLTDGAVFAIVPDDLGNVWINSIRGILRIGRQSMDAVWTGKSNQIESTIYDGLDSVRTIDAWEVEYAGCKTADGRIWFPTAQGIVMVDPANLSTNRTAPPVHIQQVSINGVDWVDPNQKVPPGKGELRFQYTALSYIAPQKVRFRYRLEGYDKDWIDAGNRRSASYTNLKPKKYTFRVQACNADGIWNTSGAAFDIELPPRVFQTWWFQSLAAASAVAVLFLIYVWRVKHLELRQRKLQATNELLERRIQERTSELADQRNLLRTLIDHLPDDVFVKDTQSRVIIDNLAHAHTLGVNDPAQAVGKTDLDCFTQEQAEKFRCDDQALLETGVEYNGEEKVSNINTGKVRWQQTTKVPLRDSQGRIIGLAGIHRDITERKKWEAELESLHKQLVEASRHAGRAEVATSVLHNVGNVLNSVNISASIVADKIRNSATDNLSKMLDLLQAHESDLSHFLTKHEKGKKLIVYLDMLIKHLDKEKAKVLEEMKYLGRNLEHIKEIVSMQQNYARVVGVVENVKPSELADDALQIQAAAFERHGISIVREYGDVPAILIDRHKVIQILVNLLQNAKYACDSRKSKDRRISVHVTDAGKHRVKIEIADNGEGIPPDNLTRIFSFGFTTRKNGHGFGLHSGALAAKEMGGNLTAHSDGTGHGARFTLELPLVQKSRPTPTSGSDKMPVTIREDAH
jgi:PAS domain S-box-containing protein